MFLTVIFFQAIVDKKVALYLSNNSLIAVFCKIDSGRIYDNSSLFMLKSRFDKSSQNSYTYFGDKSLKDIKAA